jgi:HK97 family phage major capsid protein
MNKKQLMQKRAALIDQAKAVAEGEQTAETRATFDNLMKQADELKADIARAEKLEAESATLDESDGLRAGKPDPKIELPTVNKTQRGDTEERALAHYIRTGDRSRELRASNDTDMNIGTAADGGVTVPTGLNNRIIAKRNESMLADRLGVERVPGKGTTVDSVVDNGTANEFVSTGETVAFDRDAPVLAKKSLTLVKYTKKLTLSYELMQDEDAAVMAYLENYVGRAWAKTHNQLLVTEALASGSTNALGSASAATAADIPKLVYALPDGYQDNTAWLMRRATEGAYRSLAGNAWQFAPMPAGAIGASGQAQLWGSPVFNTGYAEAVATTKKSLIFGNFNFMQMREDPQLVVLRDPYSSAANGQVNLFYYMRTVYKLSVAEAIQYGTHP